MIKLTETVCRNIARTYWKKFRSGDEVERMVERFWPDYLEDMAPARRPSTQEIIAAVLDAIAEPSEAQISAAQRSDTLAGRNREAVIGRYSAMIAALRKELG
jgi:hypothetical protein